MKLELNDAKEILDIENTDAGLPLRGVHIRPDGTPGIAPGSRYVDLDAPPDPITSDRAGWSMRVREVSDDIPRDVIEDKVEKIKDPPQKARIKKELKDRPNEKAPVKESKQEIKR